MKLSCRWAMLLLAMGAGTSTADFQPDVAKRTSQPVQPASIVVTFYSDYEEGATTVSNHSSYPLRLSSYDGFVARIPAGELLAVPCEGNSVMGSLEILDGTLKYLVDEYPLCGDVVVLRNEEVPND